MMPNEPTAHTFVTYADDDEVANLDLLCQVVKCILPEARSRAFDYIIDRYGPAAGGTP